MRVLISAENHEFQILNQCSKMINWKILYAFCVGIINLNKNGFTLLEIILVIAILFIISGLFYSAYLDGSKTFTFNKNKIELQRAQDITNSWLSKFIRISNFGTLVVNDGNKLEFDTILDPSSKIEYYLNNGYLFIDINDVGGRKICDCEFENINFIKNNDLQVIEFSATIKNDDENRDPYVFSNIFYPRVQN